jgi:hypothetical protein
MVNLQELIVRGRMIFEGASKRLEVFEFVDGVLPTNKIAKKAHRSLSAVDKDIEKLKDMELIQEKKDGKGNTVKRNGSTVYEKNPVIKHIALSYFSDVADTTKLVKRPTKTAARGPRVPTIHVPSENEVLEICKQGEDQIYEFKAPGVEAEKITREIAGFSHTKSGGIIFYGVDDTGTIVGANMRRSDFDQKIHNSVRNTMSSSPAVQIVERKVMGVSVLMVVVPPWNKKTIYQNTRTGIYYIRRGTNIFALKPDELEKLHRHEYVV